MTTETAYLESPIAQRWDEEYITPRSLKYMRVVYTVCAYLGTSFKAINKLSSRRELVYPRQLCMYFLRIKTNCSIREIGAIFTPPFKSGRAKHHTTVMHSIETIDNLMNTDKKIKADVTGINELLGGGDIELPARRNITVLPEPVAKVQPAPLYSNSSPFGIAREGIK